jgi:hypothetical protein
LGPLEPADSRRMSLTPALSGALALIDFHVVQLPVLLNGKPLHVPVKYSVSKKGVSLTFSEQLDEESATDADSLAVEMCNYRRTRNYGSRDYLVTDPKKQGRDKLEITKGETVKSEIKCTVNVLK